jgi:hypothetical protein
MQTKTNLKIDWATHESAKYAVENWHYSKRMPSGKLVKIGVWENETFIGVVIFGLGATPNLSKTYNLTMTECCELTRIALRDHITPVSRIVAISIRLLKKQSPGIRLVVSFADSDQGHIGGIYQAGNWIYSGSPKLDSWIIHGKKIHPRSVVMKFGTQAESEIKKIDPNARKTWGFKHRYLMPLDEETKMRIQHLSKPYPKRASSKDSVASGYQSEKGGAIPTDALHTNGINKNGKTKKKR